MSGGSPIQRQDSNHKADQARSAAVAKMNTSVKTDSVEAVNKRLQKASPDEILEILINTPPETLRNVFNRFPARKDEIKKCFELKLSNAKADVTKVKRALVGLIAVADSQLLVEIVQTAEKNINQSKDKQKMLSAKLIYTAISKFADYEKHMGKDKFVGGIRDTVKERAGLKDYSTDLAKYDPKRFGVRPVSSEARTAIAKLPASIMQGRSQPVSEEEFINLAEKYGIDAVLGSHPFLAPMAATSAYDRHDFKSLYRGYVAAFHSFNGSVPTESGGTETTVIAQAEQTEKGSRNTMIVAKTNSEDIKKEIKKDLEGVSGSTEEKDRAPKAEVKLPDLSDIKEAKSDPKLMKEFINILKGQGKSKKT
jgi:hypothetical protein